MGPDAMIFIFWMLNFKPTFPSPLSLSSRDFSSSSLSAKGWCHLHMWGYWYFSWQSWFQLVIHPAWHFAGCTLHISEINRVTIYSFPNLEPVYCSMSGSNCCFLICLQMSQEAGKVVWYSHLSKNFPQFDVIHTVKGFSVVNEVK